MTLKSTGFSIRCSWESFGGFQSNTISKDPDLFHAPDYLLLLFILYCLLSQGILALPPQILRFVQDQLPLNLFSVSVFFNGKTRKFTCIKRCRSFSIEYLGYTSIFHLETTSNALFIIKQDHITLQQINYSI